MRRIFVIVTILALTGCAEKSRFDCPYVKGPSCSSMDQIDKRIKSGNLDAGRTCCKNNSTKSVVKSAPVTLTVQTNANNVLRVPEQVLQMWVAPYEATNGIYYQQAFINIIVKGASWQAPVLDDASTREAYHG